jgi:class I fructose-bisphosphate aldolase
MGYIGRKVRESRLLFSDSDCGLIVPIDHGLTVGPIHGIEDIDTISEWITNKNISAIIAHKGLLEHLVIRDLIRSNLGIVVHLNGMSNFAEDGNTKCMLTDVEAAIRLGADAVSVQINFTENNFYHNLDLLGKVVDSAHRYGLPVLTMLYDKVKITNNQERVNRMNTLMRLCIELGTDALKISLPEHRKDLSTLLRSHVKTTKVFFAGGEVTSQNSFVDNITTAISLGSSGVCAGRNIFQHPNPNLALKLMANTILNTNKNEIGRFNPSISSSVKPQLETVYE